MNFRIKEWALALISLLFIVPLYAQEFDSERIRLGNQINTKFTETKPIISYDNKELYLTRQNHPENTAGVRDIQDIFMAKRSEDGLWLPPNNIGEPLNNKFPNGISSLSSGADTALVINVWYENDFEKGASISTKNDGEWAEPEAVYIENFKNKSEFVDYFISSSGEQMFLAIESKNTVGDQDIYISQKIDDFNWTEPINLGESINTPEGEFSPFLSSDNRILFFASYGHEGYGESDIFYSERLGDSWTDWSEPKNLGNKINTAGFEAYFTIPARGDYAYFVSDVKSNSDSRDIFKAFIPIELNPTPGVVVSGNTIDDLSKKPVAATVSIDPDQYGMPTKLFVTNADNDFNYRRSILEFPVAFKLIAEADGYMSAYQYLTIAYKDKREVNADLYMLPVKVGNTLVSHDITFASGSLDDRGEKEVARIINYMVKYPSIKMDIGSHVASSNSKEGDMKSSEGRLNIVYQRFIEAGIDENRLSVGAFGSDQPFENANNLLFDKGIDPDNRMSFTIYADKDDDGVGNKKDKCPDEPGIRKNQGCPEIAEEVVEVFEQALSGIQFETSKDVIKPVSFDILNNVVSIMRENPAYYLKIMGHTDSQGKEESNQILSEKRATATLKYLADKGVESSRMKAYGYGELVPVADNATSEGRAKNRRVVFKILFDKETLQNKELEQAD